MVLWRIIPFAALAAALVLLVVCSGIGAACGEGERAAADAPTRSRSR